MKIRGKPPRGRAPCARLAHVSTPTVLLVEDEPEIVGLLTDFLAVEGFGVVAADDARAAIAALGRHDVDCVLLDVMLPGASGFDVCRRIRERSDVPLLFLSARGEDDDKLRGLAQDQYVRQIEIPARRGDIFDRRGTPFAQSASKCWSDCRAHPALRSKTPSRMRGCTFMIHHQQPTASTAAPR